MLDRGRQRGDTLIEVLFAVTVLSLAIVAALSIMNQGTSAALRSMHITLVRQEIDSQAEALRFMNKAYVSAYKAGYAPTARTTPAEEYYFMLQDIISKGVTSASKFGGDMGDNCPAIPTTSFIINPKTVKYQPYASSQFVPASNFSQVTYSGSGATTFSQAQGIWIEAVRSAPRNGTAYVDFHIRACWPAPGMSTPLTLGTIVRLYEPAR